MAKNLSLIIVLSSLFIGINAANKSNYLQLCLNQCENAKQICGAQATLTLARVNSCAAVDEDFGDNYDCKVICRQNPRTVRFESVK